MYDFLIKYLPQPLAEFLTGIWFTVLICLVLFAAFEPQGTFRYAGF